MEKSHYFSLIARVLPLDYKKITTFYIHKIEQKVGFSANILLFLTFGEDFPPKK